MTENLPAALETAIWKLYEDFEAEFENRKIFDPLAEIYSTAQRAPVQQAAAAAVAIPAPDAGGAPPTAGTAPEVVATAAQPMAAAAPPGHMMFPIGPHVVPPGTSANFDILVSGIESSRRSSQFRQEIRFVVTGTGPSGEPLLRQETLAQGWKHSEAPTAAQS